MPKDDQTFFSDMDAADKALQTASAKNLGAFLQMDQFVYYYHYFRDLGRISGGTEPVIKQIEDQILPRLKKYDPANNESPVETIRGKLERWQGPHGSAAYQFKWDYLPGLATALGNQYSTMQAMAAVMTTQEAIIDQARQKYLDLIDTTTAMIKKSTREQNQKSSVAVAAVTVVASIATTLGIAATGGAGATVAGLALGALRDAGGVIDAASSNPVGDDPRSIASDAIDKLGKIKAAVKDETQNVQNALDAVLSYVDGEYRDQFLAPPVKL